MRYSLEDGLLCEEKFKPNAEARVLEVLAEMEGAVEGRAPASLLPWTEP